MNIKKVWRIIYWIITAVLLLIAATVALTSFEVPGGYRLYVVQSGSMEPVLKRKAVVLVQSQSEYEKGEIVTIDESPNSEVTVTHRIHEIEEEEGKRVFITKGDANDSPDGEKRVQDQIIGQVIFSVPYLGYPVSFAQTQEGLLVLVIIPAVIIVYSEIISIKNEVVKMINKKKKKEKSES